MGIPGVTAPARLGRYELLARLASGGMGEIFLSRLEGAAGFEKLLVVKRILPHLADDARFRAMLIAEARIASRMAHANICQVYELGETDGQLYIVMEHLEGIGLLALLRKASKEDLPLDFGLVGGIVQQCTEALHYAHELRDRNNELLGIVHRDVTPGNIFITASGMAKLLDFGIAKAKDASANTQTGTIKGKYAYMAPEQLRGQPADRRADVFALGIVLFEMLALRRLFQRATDYLTFGAVMEQPIPDVRRYRPDIPDALAEVLARALDRDPDRRPATARQLGASVVGALGPHRPPWSQPDISDFLRAHFPDEIERSRVETSRALTWSAGPQGRAAVSAIDDAAPPEPDDEDDFPAVDSDVEDVPLEASPQAYAGQAQAATEPGGPAPARQPAAAPAADAAPPMVVVHQRSILWPLLALAMVGITATALFLVWKQTRQPETIVVTTEPATGPAAAGPAATGPAATDPAATGPAAIDPAATGPGSGAVAPPPAPSGSGAPAAGARGSARAGGRGATPAPKPPDPYTLVINGHRPQMTRCVNDSPLPEGSAKVNVMVKVVVEPSGKPKEVSFEPATLDDTAAGACIKRTLSAATFPRAKAEVTVRFPIWI